MRPALRPAFLKIQYRVYLRQAAVHRRNTRIVGTAAYHPQAVRVDGSWDRSRCVSSARRWGVFRPLHLGRNPERRTATDMSETRNFCRADRLRLATLFQSTEETRYYLNGDKKRWMTACVWWQWMGTGAVFRDEAAFTCASASSRSRKARARIAIKSAEGPRVRMVRHHRPARRHRPSGGAGCGRQRGMASMEEIRPPSGHDHPAVVWAGAVELIDGNVS